MYKNVYVQKHYICSKTCVFVFSQFLQRKDGQRASFSRYTSHYHVPSEQLFQVPKENLTKDVLNFNSSLNTLLLNMHIRKEKSKELQTSEEMNITQT